MIEIKHKTTRKVIYTYDGDSLGGAYLRGTDFRNADLSYADLSRANLIDANFRGADLRWADLRWADLHGADLSNAKINNCIGNMQKICSMQLETWTICFTKDQLAIGCEQHPIEEWKNFSDEQISRMHTKALDFWRKWKAHIFTSIELSNVN